MPMIATTIISSIRVKPFCSCFMVCSLLRDYENFFRSALYAGPPFLCNSYATPESTPFGGCTVENRTASTFERRIFVSNCQFWSVAFGLRYEEAEYRRPI